MTNFILLWFLIAILAIILPIIVLVKVLTDKSISNESKVLWVVIVLVTNLVGAIIYLLIPDKNVLN